MIAVIFEVMPHAEHRQAYLDTAASLLPHLEQIDGFISIERFESLGQPGKVLFYERWADRVSWENHIAGIHSVAFRAQAGEWIGDFELLQMRQVA